MKALLGPALFCAVYLASQLVLAARGPLNPNEQVRFAWRMFLRSAQVPRYDISFRDGRVVALDSLTPRPPVEFLGRQVNRLRFVPPHLCRHVPDAVRIRVHLPGGRASSVFRCP